VPVRLSATLAAINVSRIPIKAILTDPISISNIGILLSRYEVFINFEKLLKSCA